MRCDVGSCLTITVCAAACLIVVVLIAYVKCRCKKQNPQQPGVGQNPQQPDVEQNLDPSHDSELVLPTSKYYQCCTIITFLPLLILLSTPCLWGQILVIMIQGNNTFLL